MEINNHKTKMERNEMFINFSNKSKNSDSIIGFSPKEFENPIVLPTNANETDIRTIKKDLNKLFNR
jgi:hypothetical protein